MRNNNHKSAFSLAEVLITLAILGVVAMLTVPHIQHSYQERVTVTKVKKMYSIIDNAFRRQNIDRDRPRLNRARYTEDDPSSTQNIYDDFIAPNFDVSYVAGTETSKKQKIMATKYNFITGNRITTYNGYFAVKLKDGSVLFFRPTGNAETSFLFFIDMDVNGKKGPNVSGIDVFHFTIKENIGIDTSEFKDMADQCGNRNPGAEDCTAYIILNGKMKYKTWPIR